MKAKIGGLWSLGLAGMIAAIPTPSWSSSRVSDQARMRAEAQLDSCVAKVEMTARRQGEIVVATRIAHELGVEPALLMSEQASLGCFLGDLLIAHSIQANANTVLSARQLVEMHDGGNGWADIAVDLGLRLNHVVRGLINETRVAAGLSRGDGRVAVMRSDGTRAGPAAGPSAAGGVTTLEPGSSSHSAGARGIEEK